MVGICLYTPPVGVVVCPPYVCTPPVCLYAPIHVCMAPRGVHTPPWAPHVLCAPVWFWQHCMLWGVAFLFYVYWDTPPLFVGASPFITPPTLHCWLLCALLFSGISVLMWGPFPLLLKGLGVFPPSLGEVWGDTSALCCSHAHSVYTFFL